MRAWTEPAASSTPTLPDDIAATYIVPSAARVMSTGIARPCTRSVSEPEPFKSTCEFRSTVLITAGAAPGCALMKVRRLDWKRPRRFGSNRTAFELSRFVTASWFVVASKTMLPLLVPTP